MFKHPLSLPIELSTYILEHSLREASILTRLREVTAELPNSRMQVSPEQGQFLQLLTRLVGARSCIEIGTFTGYSSLAIALALPGDGNVITCDVSEEWTGIARKFWLDAGVASKITLRLQPALRTLDELLAAGNHGCFDLAFIDADKTNYIGYYERILQLLRSNGLVLADNTLWSGTVADPRVTDDNTTSLRAFNDLVHHDERVDMVLLPFGDGLTILRKR